MEKSNCTDLDILVEALELGNITLTPWEEQFMEDMVDKPDDYEITPSQLGIITAILDRV